MKPFETGLHGETEHGPIDLGLFITADGLGVAIDAPQLGQLRAAFDLGKDGEAKLTSLSREGRPVQGLTDVARIIDLETQLHARNTELETLEARLEATEQALAQHEADAEQRLQHAQSALGATQASLEQIDAHKAQAQTQLDLTQKTLSETETRLRRTQSDLSISKTAFTELDLKLRASLAEGRRNKTLLDETQARFKLAQADLTIAKTTLSDTEGRLRRLQGQHDQLKDETDARLGATGAEARDLSTRVTAAEEAKQTAETLLEDARALISSLEAERGLYQTQAASAELERDDAQRKLQLAEDTATASSARASKLETERDTYKAQAASARLGRDEAQRKLKLVEDTGGAHSARASELETELDETKRRLAVSEETRHRDGEHTAAELQQALSNGATLSEQLNAEQARAQALETEVKGLKTANASQGSELEEERARRDEMVRDLSYIQSQMSDLSSSKGALIARVSQMTDRETKRQRTTTEMHDAVRDAEVVAADRKAMARRQEARAAKLEDQMSGMTQEILDLRGRAEVAENSVLMLGEQLTKITAERNSLKVDVQFFQKQIGSMQRLLAQQIKQPPKK